MATKNKMKKKKEKKGKTKRGSAKRLRLSPDLRSGGRLYNSVLAIHTLAWQLILP